MNPPKKRPRNTPPAPNIGSDGGPPPEPTKREIPYWAGEMCDLYPDDDEDGGTEKATAPVPPRVQ